MNKKKILVYSLILLTLVLCRKTIIAGCVVAYMYIFQPDVINSIKTIDFTSTGEVEMVDTVSIDTLNLQ